MPSSSGKQGGFTLIELLVAITVGLLVISVASTVLQRTVRDHLKIRDSAMLRESAFFTSHFVEQHLRQTGYKSIDSNLVAGRRSPIPQDDEIFPEVIGAWSQGQYLKVSENSIGIRFNGSSDSLGVADGSIVDCAGNAIGADVVSDISIALTNGQLICSSDGVQQTLLGSDETLDVDVFTITLGIDDGDDGSIDRYVDSTAATDVDLVGAREIVLRMLLVSNQRLDALNRSYIFNGSEITYPDNYYRREILIRTMLRNAKGLS